MPNIIKIVILTERPSCDVVYIYFDCPSGVYPFTEPLSAKFEVSTGSGEDYVKEHFRGISDVEIIKCK